MLYTGRGDDGTTTLYGNPKRIGKDSIIIEALGSIDEINSFIGWCKASVTDTDIKKSLERAQQTLFVLQAELAGADKRVRPAQVQTLEKAIKDYSAELPKIKGFVVAGETDVAAMLDVGRTIARRAERTVNRGLTQGEIKIHKSAQAYLNRLSSLLYVLARVVNARAHKVERPPKY
jgi:cob(I)alamin adenosyltransferase